MTKKKPLLKAMKPLKKAAAAKASKPVAKVVAKPASAAPKKAPAAMPGFSSVVILSAGDDLTGAEAELKLRTVVGHLHATLPPLTRISGLEASVDATALALYRAFRAHGRGGRALYVVGTSPTHTPSQGALSMLVTDWGNTILGANDGSMALLAHLFTLRGIPYRLAPLDVEALTASEQERMQNPDWQPAPDFSLRDLLAPAAAALLAGATLDSMAEPTPTRTNAAGPKVLSTAFVSHLSTLPLNLGKSLSVTGLPLGEGRYLLNLTTDPLTFDQLLDDQARFRVSVNGKPRLWPLSVGVGGAHSSYTPLIQLSPIQAPAWDERFLVMRINPCHVPADGVCSFTLTRVQ